MLSFEIKGLKELSESLTALEKRELPFATARMLTACAKDVQEAVIAQLPSQFTLRTGWYKPNTPYGFKVKSATKANLQAEVFTRAPWMLLHEEGGTKQAVGKRLAVPFVQKQGAVPGVEYGVKRTKRDLIMKSQKPRNLRNSFIIHGTNGDLIAQRKGKGKRSVLHILYALEQQALIKRRLGFADTARRVIKEVLRKRFDEAMQYALKTSRFK